MINAVSQMLMNHNSKIYNKQSLQKVHEGLNIFQNCSLLMLLEIHFHASD